LISLFLFVLLAVVRIAAALLTFLVLLRSGLFLLMGRALLRLSVLRMLRTVRRALRSRVAVAVVASVGTRWSIIGSLAPRRTLVLPTIVSSWLIVIRGMSLSRTPRRLRYLIPV
jgi:predicted membrane protein